MLGDLLLTHYGDNVQCHPIFMFVDNVTFTNIITAFPKLKDELNAYHSGYIPYFSLSRNDRRSYKFVCGLGITPNINIMDESTLNSATISACKYGHLESVKFLFSAGLARNLPSAFATASASNKYDIVRWLYENKPMTNISEALKKSMEIEDSRIINYLLSQKKITNVIQKVPLFHSALVRHAVMRNKNDIVKTLCLLKDTQFDRQMLEGALKCGNIEIVKKIIQNKPIKSWKKLANASFFNLACITGQLEALKFVANHDDTFMERMTKQMSVAYYDAAHHGHLAVLEFLYDHDNGMACKKNAIETACYNNYINIVKFLYEKVDSCCLVTSPRLYKIACVRGNLEIIKYLLSVGVKGFGDGAMIMACKYNHMDVVKYLVAQNKQIGIGGINYLCHHGHYAFVKSILEHITGKITGCKSNMHHVFDFSNYFKCGDYELTILLCIKGIINKSTIDEVLIAVCRAGASDIRSVVYLLDVYCALISNNINIDLIGDCMFHASGTGRLDIVQLLEQYISDDNININNNGNIDNNCNTDNNGNIDNTDDEFSSDTDSINSQNIQDTVISDIRKRCLLTAISNSKLNVIKYFHETYGTKAVVDEINTNIKHFDAYNALVRMAENGNIAVARYVFDNKLYASFWDNMRSVIDCAIKSGNIDMVVLLHGAFGISYDMMDYGIVYAAEYGHLNIVDLYLPFICKTNEMYAVMAFYRAVSHGYANIVKLLCRIINNKAFVMNSNEYNKSFTEAVFRNQYDMIKVLLENDIVPNIKNMIELAMTNNYHEIARILEAKIRGQYKPQNMITWVEEQGYSSIDAYFTNTYD